MHHNISCLHPFYCLLCCAIQVPFCVKSSFIDIIFNKGSYTSAVAAEMFLCSLVYPEMTAVLFWILVVACLLALVFFWNPSLHLAGRLFHHGVEYWCICF